MRRAIAQSLLALPFLACNPRPLDKLEHVTTAVVQQAFALPGQARIDLLFVIDNSQSMLSEQANLARNFDRFSALIAELDADVRIAVTSTNPDDRGAFLAQPPRQVALTDDRGEPIALDVAHCQTLADADALPTVLATGPQGNVGQGCADAACVRDELEAKFRCLATLGYASSPNVNREAGLQAMVDAVSCAGPNAAHFGACCVDGAYDPTCDPTQAGDFLRPDALLVVVFLSDEDDCSAPGVFQPGDPLFACQTRPEALVPVADFYRPLIATRPDPSRLVVGAIVGPRVLTTAGEDLRYAEGELPDQACAFDAAELAPQGRCCPGGVCPGTVRRACESPNGRAAAGTRYLDFVELFGARGVGCTDPGDAACVTVCDGDLSAPIERLRDEVRRRVGRFCLDAAPRCLVPEAEGARPCFTATEEADPANYAVQVRQQCLRTRDQGGRCSALVPPTVLGRGDWRLDPTAAECSSGVALELAALPPPGADVTVEYARAVR